PRSSLRGSKRWRGCSRGGLADEENGAGSRGRADPSIEAGRVTMATVRIPGSLRAQVGGASTLEVDGATVQEVLDALASQHPGIRGRLLDDGGQLRRFVNVFVDDEDIRHRDGLHTPVEPGQRVSILPAVAAG